MGRGEGTRWWLTSGCVVTGVTRSQSVELAAGRLGDEEDALIDARVRAVRWESLAGVR